MGVVVDSWEAVKGEGSLRTRLARLRPFDVYVRCLGPNFTQEQAYILGSDNWTECLKFLPIEYIYIHSYLPRKLH